MFSLDVRCARKGDCLLLHFGSKSKPGLIMIDGGPSDVYLPHLRPRIEQIRKARKLKDTDSLPVDLLMISHVDDDHIRGILDLTKELVTAKGKQQPLLLRPRSVWHNSFDKIINKDPKELTAAFKSNFGAAAFGGGLPSDATIDADKALDQKTILANLKVLASIAQGSRLRDDVKALKFEPNLEFGGELVIARKGDKPKEIASGLKLTVIGPMLKEIQDLQEEHDKWLEKLKKEGKKPAAALAAYLDESVANLSSIVALAEADGHSMLLTGDARGDKILKGLEMVGRLTPNGTLKVDLLKAPHHGSDNNVELDFFQRIVADHYVFSGNGEHGNPERETLEMLLKARGNEKYTVHLTYPLKVIDKARKEEWEKQRANEQAKKDKETDPVKKKKKTVRAAWSPAKHSLGAFLAANPKFAAKVKFVDAKKAHVIDLSDPLKKSWDSLG